MRKLFSALALLATLTSLAQVQLIDVGQYDDYEDVLKIARKTDRFLFLIIPDREGNFTYMVDTDVFDDRPLSRALAAEIPIIAQPFSEMGERFANTFPIAELPAFLVMSPDEILLEYTTGIKSSAELLQLVQNAHRNDSLYPLLKQAYLDKTLTTEQWPTLLKLYGFNQDFSDAQNLAYEYFAEIPKSEWVKPTSLPYAQRYLINLETEFPLEVWRAMESANVDSSERQSYFERVYDYNMELAIFNEDSLLLENILQKWVPNSPGTNPKALRLESSKYFATETDLFTHFVYGVQHYVENSDSLVDTAEFVYDEAFFIADNFNSANSQRAARELALLAAQYKTDFRFHMLAGYMSYLLEEYEVAVKYVNKAKEENNLEENESKANALLRLIERAEEESGSPLETRSE